VVLLGSACGGGEGDASATPTPCPSATGAVDLSLLPRDVELDRFAEIQEIVREDEYVNVAALAETTVVELDPSLQRSLLDAGYEIIGHDNEGFEAEIFFARDERTLGTFRLRAGPCEGHVTVRLIYTSPRIATS
jgi:hypothetical protein